MTLVRSYHSQDKAARMFGRKDQYKIGFELEIQNMNAFTDEHEEAAKMVSDTFKSRNYVYFEYDSSVRSGFEIITAPQTVKYIRKHQDLWKDALKGLSTLGYKSHETTACGLHVHVGVEAFGELASEQEFNMTKAVLIVERFWSSLVVLARRDSSWARRINCTTPTDIESHVKRTKGMGSDHGRAVNLGNAKTVEFRLFRGTLKPDTLFASIELVVAIVSASNNLRLRDIVEAATLREVLTRGCMGRLNEQLDAYLTSKGM